MSDIDFDELDKAVNSLMGNVKPGKDDEPKAKTLEVKDTLKPGEEPEYNKLEEAAQKIGSEALVTEREQTLVEHFEPEKTEQASEHDKQLTELANEINDRGADVVTAVAPKEEPKPTPVERPQNTASSARPLSSGRFMDVVRPTSNMRAAAAIPPAKTTPVSIAPPVKPVESAVAVSTGEDVPLTPFLPDANEKIEKRPLGAVPSPFADTAEVGDILQTQEPQESIVNTQDIPPIDKAENEVASDVSKRQKLEEEQVDRPPINAAEMVMETSPEERALQEIESKEVTIPPSGADNIAKIESGDTGNLRHPRDDEKDTPGGAIFDTEQYHQPLSHPKKQKSGWGKVIIITLIIIICAAGAGAAYLFFA